EPGAGADGDEQCAAGDAERRRDGRDRTADAVGPFGHDRGLLDPLVETAVAKVGAERVAEAGRLPAAHAVTTPAAMLQRGSGAASAPPGPSSSTPDSLGAARMTWPWPSSANRSRMRRDRPSSSSADTASSS